MKDDPAMRRVKSGWNQTDGQLSYSMICIGSFVHNDLLRGNRFICRIPLDLKAHLNFKPPPGQLAIPKSIMLLCKHV